MPLAEIVIQDSLNLTVFREDTFFSMEKNMGIGNQYSLKLHIKNGETGGEAIHRLILLSIFLLFCFIYIK